MIIEIVLCEIEKEYGIPRSQWCLHEQPINCLDVTNMLHLNKPLSMQVIFLFDFVKDEELVITEWDDFIAICRFVLQNASDVQTYRFDINKVSQILQRAIVAQYYGLPLLPGYKGRGMGHIDDFTNIKHP